MGVSYPAAAEGKGRDPYSGEDGGGGEGVDGEPVHTVKLKVFI